MRAAVFYLRLMMVILGAALGLPGCFLGTTLILVRILSITDFGVPYAAPLETPTVQGMKDTVVRLPWNMMKTRPAFNHNLKRQGEGNEKK